MGDVTYIYFKIITEFQGMFFQLNCKVLTNTQNTKKHHISTKTTTCKLYVVCWQLFFSLMVTRTSV